MATEAATPSLNGDRRRSGRAVHAPSKYSQEQQNFTESAKRKRNPSDQDDGLEQDSSGESESEEGDGEADEEDMMENKRRQRPRKAVSKPAAKRPKTTAGASTTLAIRSGNAPVKNVSKTAKKKARSRPSQVEATGLFADVFGRGFDAETAAATWHNKMEADHVAGITEIVNFVLETIGCNARITSDDVSDVDGVPVRLTEVQEQYAEQKEPDYPLSGKQKQYHGMKEVFVEFFKAILHALHNSGLLYEETAIYDNLHVWTATMSGASYRSFRVTATIASLAMTTAQTELANEIRSSIATTKQQLDAEKKKKNANRGRLTKLQEEMDKDEKRLELIDNQLKDVFDTVYVHRYRDVEEKLRVECASAMGQWILNYRHLFLEGQYLRYLGWVMSDPHAPTRLEVVRQLKAIYKIRNNLSALRGFTDRFRPRMVEIGARDADVGVRVETIELLDMLRGAEMLEPNDIDSVGQLIFDGEPQVRKAVAHFFVSNINDIYNLNVEDFDKDDFDTALPDVEKIDDFDEPCKLWIKFKWLAQTLGSQAKKASGSRTKNLDLSSVDNLDSRYMVATQAIFSAMPELEEWESLAGYLLHDHSNITSRNSSDINVAVQKAYKLENGEEIILLDVLYCAAKIYILEPPDSAKGKKTSKAKEEMKQRQETAAHNLSAFIPKLHSKFGSVPRAATAILRLNQIFNPDLVNEIEEEDEVNTLLDDINKAFTSHSDIEVLAEAIRALRAALAHSSTKDAASSKVNEMWKNITTYNMSELLTKAGDVSERGTLDPSDTAKLADVTERLAQLASVQDCCDFIDGRFPWLASKASRKKNDTVMQMMLSLIKRGKLDDDTPRHTAQLEDQICVSAIKIVLFYYRWKMVALKTAITDNDAKSLTAAQFKKLEKSKNDFMDALLPVIASRKPLDTVRKAALLGALDLCVLFATLRSIKPKKGALDGDLQSILEKLSTDIGAPLLAAVMETHEKMEKRLAKRMNKKNVDLPLAKAQKAEQQAARGVITSATVNGHSMPEDDQIDRPPEDSDDENANESDEQPSEDDSSNDGDHDRTSDAENGLSSKDLKRKAALVAETALCELTAKIVLALIAEVVPDSRTVKTRLQLNRTKLGKSYTQVIAYSDDKKEKAKAKNKAGTEPKTPQKGVLQSKTRVAEKHRLSEPMVVGDDDIESVDDDDDPDNLAEHEDDNASREDGNDNEESREEPEDADADEDDVMGD